MSWGLSSYQGILLSITPPSPPSPEDVPRLFDLVKSKDPRYLTAFYHALRDTLVGRDLEQATRIGLQGRTRYRVVTLTGQVVDIAGEVDCTNKCEPLSSREMRYVC